MISRQEYAYGIGDEIVHNGVVLKYMGEYNGVVLKYGGEYNGHRYTITAAHEDWGLTGTVVFKNKLRNEGYNK